MIGIEPQQGTARLTAGGEVIEAHAFYPTTTRLAVAIEALQPTRTDPSTYELDSAAIANILDLDRKQGQRISCYIPLIEKCELTINAAGWAGICKLWQLLIIAESAGYPAATQVKAFVQDGRIATITHRYTTPLGAITTDTYRLAWVTNPKADYRK